jgi:hypothetical protein
LEKIAKYSRCFRPNFSIFFLKSKIEMFSNQLKIKKLVTLLGLPSSFEEILIPYNEITSITYTKRIHKSKILFGLLLIVLGFYVISNSPGISLTAILFGAYQLINSYVGEIKIKQRYNQITIIEIAISELKYVDHLIKQLPISDNKNGN